MSDSVRIELYDDRFGLVLNAAVRHALTSGTYMPVVVVDFITPLLPKLNDRTLYTFCEDIKESGACSSVFQIFLGDVKRERARRRLEMHAVDAYDT